MLVADRRSFRPSWVEKHEASTALAYGGEARAGVTEGPHAPHAGDGVRAEHDEKIGAVDVGDRHRECVAIDLQACEEARVGVLRVGVINVVRAQGRREDLHPERGAVTVNRRVADVERDRIAPVPRADLAEPPRSLPQRVVPAHLLEPTRSAAHRHT